jgi:hypothetical protein
MGLFAMAHGRVQQAFRLWQVIDIPGLAAGVQPGAVVFDAGADHA